MKRSMVFILIASIFLVSCGNSKIINGIERNPVGVISIISPEFTGNYSKNVKYEPCWGNIIWGAILIETVIAPIYFYGFSMFNPVGIKDTVGE